MWVIVAEFDSDRQGFIGSAFVIHPDGGSDGAPPRVERCHALWDTGAATTCISTSLAERLNLPSTPCDTAIYGVGGYQIVSRYHAGISMRTKDGKIYQWKSLFCGFNKEVHHADFDVIIGMDIIQRGRLVIGKVSGKLTLRYSINDSESV